MPNQIPTIPASNTEEEGVIKFKLEFNAAPPQEVASTAELTVWRQILHRLGLTGRDPSRYEGLAYGNVSQRTGPRQFVISGTQTGGKSTLSPDDYCEVVDFDLAKNWVLAEGPIEPSSEALTHGTIYAGNQDIRCVLHVHSPTLWHHSKRLGLLETDAAIAYGTPALAQAVGQIVRERTFGIISMRGHEDGLIAFAETIAQAGMELVNSLAKAEKIDILATTIPVRQLG